MSTELLAPLDLAFWHLETDAHPMHLGALAVFEAAPGAQPRELLELLGTRAAAIPRLRMRVRDVLLPVGGAAWFTDKDFDVHRHVKRIVLSGDDFMPQATRLAGELMEQPLERGLPPGRCTCWTAWATARSPCSSSCTTPSPTGCGPLPSAPRSSTRSRPPRLYRGAVRRLNPVPPRSWLPGPYEAAGMALDRLGDVRRALGVGASVVRAEAGSTSADRRP